MLLVSLISYVDYRAVGLDGTVPTAVVADELLTRLSLR